MAKNKTCVTCGYGTLADHLILDENSQCDQCSVDEPIDTAMPAKAFNDNGMGQ